MISPLFVNGDFSVQQRCSDAADESLSAGNQSLFYILGGTTFINNSGFPIKTAESPANTKKKDFAGSDKKVKAALLQKKILKQPEKYLQKRDIIPEQIKNEKTVPAPDNFDGLCFSRPPPLSNRLFFKQTNLTIN